MSDYKNNVPIEKSSPKSFGIVFSIVFFIIGIYPLIHSENLRIWSLFLSIILLLITFVFPKVLIIPNNLWFRFGNFIGGFVSYIVLFTVFIGVVCPTGFIMALFGKDQLKLKRNKVKKTYWIKRINEPSDMKHLF